MNTPFPSPAIPPGRGLRVIGAFGREKNHMTLSDVARATDLPKPSVRRALYTLTCLGLAASDGRTFRLKTVTCVGMSYALCLMSSAL